MYIHDLPKEEVGVDLWAAYHMVLEVYSQCFTWSHLSMVN